MSQDAPPTVVLERQNVYWQEYADTYLDGNTTLARGSPRGKDMTGSLRISVNGGVDAAAGDVDFTYGTVPGSEQIGVPLNGEKAAASRRRARTETIESWGSLWMLSSKKRWRVVASSRVSHSGLPAAGSLPCESHQP